VFADAFADAFVPFCGAFGFVHPIVGFQPLPPLSDAVLAFAATHCPKAAWSLGLGVDAGWTSLWLFVEPVVTFAVAVSAWLFAFDGSVTAAVVTPAVESAAAMSATRAIIRVVLIRVSLLWR